MASIESSGPPEPSARAFALSTSLQNCGLVFVSVHFFIVVVLLRRLSYEPACPLLVDSAKKWPTPQGLCRGASLLFWVRKTEQLREGPAAYILQTIRHKMWHTIRKLARPYAVSR